MDGCGGWSFHSGSELQQEQGALPISSQVEEQLKQIYLLMDMEEHEHAEAAPSSQSSTFHSSASPDEAASSLMPGSSSATYYGDSHYAGQCYGDLDMNMALNLEEFTSQEAHHEQREQRKNGHGGGAFMPYSRHLSTKKKPKLGSGGGQRAIKAAMSALARMHMVRLAQWQCYQMEMAAAAQPTTAGSNCNQVQVQHVLSERKRREKLNDSFKALKTVLPPAPKKDKASILIRARDYVNTLKSRVSELEQRNRMLVELQHHNCNNGGDRDDVSDERIEVDIDRAAVVEETSQEYYNLKIVVRSGCNATDAVVVVLESLKEIGEVILEAMDTGSGATTLTLQMKTSRCDDNFLKESVIKSVKGAMQSKIETH
nr:unnamed protein product [Digitaria exilis]